MHSREKKSIMSLAKYGEEKNKTLKLIETT